jgi:hypothetical protein
MFSCWNHHQITVIQKLHFAHIYFYWVLNYHFHWRNRTNAKRHPSSFISFKLLNYSCFWQSYAFNFLLFRELNWFAQLFISHIPYIHLVRIATEQAVVILWEQQNFIFVPSTFSMERILKSIQLLIVVITPNYYHSFLINTSYQLLVVAEHCTLNMIFVSSHQFFCLSNCSRHFSNTNCILVAA